MFNENVFKMIQIIFDIKNWHNKFVWVCRFWPKIYLIIYPSLGNLTNYIAILNRLILWSTNGIGQVHLHIPGGSLHRGRQAQGRTTGGWWRGCWDCRCWCSCIIWGCTVLPIFFEISRRNQRWWEKNITCLGFFFNYARKYGQA